MVYRPDHRLNSSSENWLPSFIRYRYEPGPMSNADFIQEMTPSHSPFSERSTIDTLLDQIANRLEATVDHTAISSINACMMRARAEMQSRFGLPAIPSENQISWEDQRAYGRVFWICFGRQVVDPARDRADLGHRDALVEALAFLEKLNWASRAGPNRSFAGRLHPIRMPLFT